MSSFIRPYARVRVIDGISKGAVGTVLSRGERSELGVYLWHVDIDCGRIRSIREDFLEPEAKVTASEDADTKEVSNEGASGQTPEPRSSIGSPTEKVDVGEGAPDQSRALAVAREHALHDAARTLKGLADGLSQQGVQASMYRAGLADGIRAVLEEVDELPDEEALAFLLTRIGSWTSARWDQHLRHEFGDDRADRAIAWLKKLSNVDVYASGRASEPYRARTRSPSRDDIWNEAIEAAAQRCDLIAEHMAPRFCAGEIRKLRRKPGGATR